MRPSKPPHGALHHPGNPRIENRRTDWPSTDSNPPKPLRLFLSMHRHAQMSRLHIPPEIEPFVQRFGVLTVWRTPLEVRSSTGHRALFERVSRQPASGSFVETTLVLPFRCSMFGPSLFLGLRNLRSCSGRHRPFPFSNRLSTAVPVATQNLHRSAYSLQLLPCCFHLFLKLRLFASQCHQDIHETSVRQPDTLGIAVIWFLPGATPTGRSPRIGLLGLPRCATTCS